MFVRLFDECKVNKRNNWPLLLHTTLAEVEWDGMGSRKFFRADICIMDLAVETRVTETLSLQNFRLTNHRSSLLAHSGQHSKALEGWNGRRERFIFFTMNKHCKKDIRKVRKQKLCVRSTLIETFS